MVHKIAQIDQKLNFLIQYSFADAFLRNLVFRVVPKVGMITPVSRFKETDLNLYRSSEKTASFAQFNIATGNNLSVVKRSIFLLGGSRDHLAQDL
jgi:hypothetical protein